MAQRISRAKQTHQDLRRALRPARRSRTHATPRRRAARAVPDLQRGLHQQHRPRPASHGLSNEAIRLTRAVQRPAAARRRGRRPARADAADRCATTRAHRSARRTDPARRTGPQRCGTATRSPRASRSSRATLSKGSIGSYQLQAAIAAVHDEAARAEDTDWPQILALYSLLLRMSDNPMVALNHAIASAMVHGPRSGTGTAGCTRCRRTPRRPPPPRRGARAFARDVPAITRLRSTHYLAAAGRTASFRNATTWRRRRRGSPASPAIVEP